MKKSSIKLRIALIYLVFTFISIAAIVFIVTDNQSHMVSDIAKYKSRDMVHEILDLLDKYSSGFSKEGVLKAGNQAQRLSLIREIIHPVLQKYAILDSSGKPVYLSSQNLKLPPDPAFQSAKVLAETDLQGSRYSISMRQNNEGIDFFIPLRQFGLNKSLLYISYPLNHITRHGVWMYRSLLLILIVVVLVHIAVSLLVFSGILAPLSKISKAVQQVVDGDYSVILKTRRRDELGQLSSNFNVMTNKINQQMTALQLQIEETEQARQEMERLATTDPLTTLYNRRYFNKQLKVAIDNFIRYRTPLSLILIDLDHFKNINDTYGHDAGDIVLKESSKLLLATCRCTDTVARYGGEELVVLMPNTPVVGARKAADKLREYLEQKDILIENGQVVKITASFGVSSLSLLSTSETKFLSDRLVSSADKALYQAKSDGRNRVDVYSPESD